jgi:hypothetical protein
VAEWLFVFNSAAVHMNQDHRSMGEVRQSFDHPGLSEPTRTNDQYFPPGESGCRRSTCSTAKEMSLPASKLRANSSGKFAG